MQKGNVLVFVLIGTLVLAAALGGYYLRTSQDSTQKACTMEAKICPDGSGVGRTGPNCEFSPCPSISPSPSDETANWKIYTNNIIGFSIKYPENWGLEITDYHDGIISIEINHPDGPPTASYGAIPYINIRTSKEDLSFGYKNNTVIDGVSAFRRSEPGGIQMAFEGIEFKKGDYKFDINLQYEDDQIAKQGGRELGIYNQQAVSIYNTMLSTFKFQ